MRRFAFGTSQSRRETHLWQKRGVLGNDECEDARRHYDLRLNMAVKRDHQSRATRTPARLMLSPAPFQEPYSFRDDSKVLMPLIVQPASRPSPAIGLGGRHLPEWLCRRSNTRRGLTCSVMLGEDGD